MSLEQDAHKTSHIKTTHGPYSAGDPGAVRTPGCRQEALRPAKKEQMRGILANDHDQVTSDHSRNVSGQQRDEE